MKYQKVSNHHLVKLTVMFTFAICQMTLYFVAPGWADENTAAKCVALPDSNSACARDIPKEPAESCPTKPDNRADSIRALVSHLGLGEGSVIADIGAGSGRDTWVFAKIVGGTGTVFAEEIAENKVESLRTEAEKRDINQVKPVLGRSDNPCLPADSADLVYMNYVYHHFARPREMLREIW